MTMIRFSNALGLMAIAYCCFMSQMTFAFPSGDFVYLRDIDSTIIQDIRYASGHNFIGHPIKGYNASECILTRPAALALAQVQKELKQSNLSLKVYDCYRPQMAVNEFMEWSRVAESEQMKPEFYPRVNKKDLFKLGYIAEKSGHTRGSTVDLTIVPITSSKSERYYKGLKLVSCFAPYSQRFHDGSIDMGTGYDCLDEMAHIDNTTINPTAYNHRQFFKNLMQKNGFIPYPPEWWHFTLKDELYPDTYFNFPIERK